MTIPDSLRSALADRYRIERELGQGGMATVYLARDLKHEREVAIKVLHPDLAAALGAERFLTEIRTTANLQHPHILPLHDSGEAGGFLFYVMPFVDGETLRDRLAREKQLPIEDALRIATETADALQHAHERGVIHRDIKPENILLQGGHALVADFGIALAASTIGGARMTEPGMSLGTPKYMSPEQAMGERTLDARTDVYALGCVLYEMLVGDPPYVASTAQAIVAKVLSEKPASIIAQRDRVPTHLEEAVLTALAKLPADRFASAAKFAEALRTPTSAPVRRLPGDMTRTGRGSRWRGPATAAALATLAALGGWWFGRRPALVADEVTRYAIALPPDQGLAAEGGSRLAWAPDGRAFVYAGAGGRGSQLWVRSLDSLSATPLSGTEGASSPFFSPDGQRIAFLRVSPFSLLIVPRVGAKPVEVPAGDPATGGGISGGGGDWSPDGYLYVDGGNALVRMRPDGSAREVVFALDSTKREVGIGWPQLLPDHRGVIARIRRSGDDLSRFTIDAFDFRSRVRSTVVQATFARYVSSGHLLYVTSEGDLMGSRFDLRTLALTGRPVLLARGLVHAAFGAADLAVSSRGALLYVTGKGNTAAIPTWVSRDGSSAPVDPTWKDIFADRVALSPDGTRLAVYLGVPNATTSSRSEDIWVKRLPSGAMSRLTFEGDQNRFPSWSHDGRDVLFVSNRAGLGALYRQRADGSRPAERVASLGVALGNAVESRDGRWTVLQTEERTGVGDIYALQNGVDSVPRPILASRFQEASPSLSPDGRWLAYQSDETGRVEVYVRPFPNVDAGKWQVSSTGGSAPRWSHKGDELFFETAGQEMMVAQVRTTPTFLVAGVKRLFSWSGYLWPYDVSLDDQRLLMVRAAQAPGAAAGSPQLIVVENLVGELKRLMP